MRKIAAQVPDQVGRLLRSGHIKTPPTWFASTVSNPPPHLTSRRQKIRTNLDERGLPSDTISSTGHLPRLRAPKSIPKEIKYAEDAVRRRFYTDFPFEALRPVSLVELRNVEGETAVSGEAWTALAQRGDYPTVEDTIEFTLKLHGEGLALTHAYEKATKEFVALRAKYEMASMAAELEARHHGAEFNESPFERHFRKEREYLDGHLDNRQKALLNVATRVSWKPPHRRKWTTYVHDTALPQSDYSKGWGYVDRWRLPVDLNSTAATEKAEAVADIAQSPESAAQELYRNESAYGYEPEPEDRGMSDLDFLKELTGKKK